MTFQTFVLVFALVTGIFARGQSTANSADGNASNSRTAIPMADRNPHPAVVGAPAAVPEEGAVKEHVYGNKYFGLEAAFPLDWKESIKGPLPSDGGYYVLANMRPQGEHNATVLISAQDMFFYPTPASNSLEMLKEMRAHLNEAQKAESGPVELQIANHTFERFDFSGAELHFARFATDIRCHVVSFMITARDPKVLEKLVQNLSSLKMAEGQGLSGESSAPICIKNYASGDNVIHKVDPELVGLGYTQVPTRFIIGIDGKVRHIHVINAYIDQAKSVEAALAQWEFKPYKVNGKAVEVESGILFEFKPKSTQAPARQTNERSIH